MSKKKTGGLKKFILALFILIMIGCALLVVDFFQKTKTPYSAYGESITVTIPKGAPVSSISRMLYEKKIVSNYYYFRIYYRLYHNNTVFKNGEYVFDRPLTMKGVIEKLYEGKVKLYKITIREGLIIKEIADVLDRHKQLEFDKDEFIRFASSPKLIQSLDPKADNLEGYLYPDTYMVRKEITTREMVKLMVRKFKEHYTNNMKWRTEELKLSIRDIITLASLIEKETSSREERFLISSVFHNRLRIGMPMGCDPTIIYALKRDNVYKGKLGWAELKYDSPYNTRLYRGLPPGPICNPGYDSIEAALYPENTKYLYFVAKDYRSHYFSKNLKEHNWAVRKFIINKKK